MGRTRFGAAIICAALAGGAAASAAQAADLVRVDGSSTTFPITEAVAEEFQIEVRGKYRVTVGVSGTGGGFKKFCRGETDISNASRPIKPSEREACAERGIRFIELPVALDAMAVMVNPRNDWVSCMTTAELKRIWEPEAQGRINNWRQVREEFPDRDLRLYGAGTDSGTYDYFTEAVVGEEGASRGDFTASEDDNVLVQGIANDINALGFFGYAYYQENTDKLKALGISHEGGPCVEPSIENAKTSRYQPLSRPLFVYVSIESLEDNPAVRELVDYYLDPQLAAELVREVGYVPLPAEAYRLARRNVAERRTGTAFAGGAQVGISIEDLLEAERQD